MKNYIAIMISLILVSPAYAHKGHGLSKGVSHELWHSTFILAGVVVVYAYLVWRYKSSGE